MCGVALYVIELVVWSSVVYGVDSVTVFLAHWIIHQERVVTVFVNNTFVA